MKLATGSLVHGMVLLGALAATFGGCAITHGDYGVPLDAANRPQPAAPSALVVSAREAAAYSSTYMGLVEVTFENRTDVWKQVDHVTIDFGDAAKNQSVTIASGDDIDAWERAIRFKCAQRPTPGSTAIEALGLRYGFDAPGPDQQLLTTPFRVPPGLFTKRWLLLSTPENPPGGCIDRMVVSYETSDHQTGRVLVPIRTGGSTWQQRSCYQTTHAGGPMS